MWERVCKYPKKQHSHLVSAGAWLSHLLFLRFVLIIPFHAKACVIALICALFFPTDLDRWIVLFDPPRFLGH